MHQYRLEKISKVFGGGQIAVDGVDLEVERGERVALIGPSGAGKTTLFRMLNCTLRPTAGKLWINGDAVSDLHGKRLRRGSPAQLVFSRPAARAASSIPFQSASFAAM